MYLLFGLGPGLTVYRPAEKGKKVKIGEYVKLPDGRVYYCKTNLSPGGMTLVEEGKIPENAVIVPFEVVVR